MSSVSLWIEISISGFFYFIAAFFIVLKVAGVKDFTFITNVKDYLALIAVSVYIASYMLGILAHRLLPFVIGWPLKSIKRLFRRKRPRAETNDDIHHFANSIEVWQYGSDRLHKELDFQFSLRSMMFSLVIGLPISGICAAIWLGDTSAQWLALPITIIGFMLGVTFYLAYRIQRSIYNQIQQAAFEEMKTIKKISQNK